MTEPRLSAYLLLADPAFIEESVRSYYPLVRRIVASYDRSHLSWSGHPVRTGECIERLKRIDTECKVEFVPGDFSSPNRPAEECETLQRNAALRLAAEGADWVIQLDTDEVLPDPRCFSASVSAAHHRNLAALDFPARWLLAEPRPGLFVERATAFLRTASGFPGPAAIRADQTLAFCRAIEAPPTHPLPQIFRVDIRRRSADPARKTGWPVHALIDRGQSILHFSWVRTAAEVADRLQFHGHATSIAPSFLTEWTKANDTPIRFVVGKAVHLRGEHYRLCRLPITSTMAPRTESLS